MENTLVDMMSGFINLTSEEKQGIIEAFPIKTYKKETMLLKEGQIAKDAFVVIKGCIREYFIQDGEEITTEFYTEFQSAVDFESMVHCCIQDRKTKPRYPLLYCSTRHPGNRGWRKTRNHYKTDL